MRFSASAIATVALALCCLCASSITLSSARSPFPMAEYRWIDYAFTDPVANESYVTNRVYENVVLTGIQVWTPSVGIPGALPMTFVSTPRWKTGVPATLSYINFTAPGRGGGYKLVPYPSWSMNAEGDPTNLQSVLGFAIDPFNRMWILDQSRIAYAAAAADSIKLIVWDLLRNVEVQRHIFPESVANRYTAFLNDLVLDLPRGFADITDSGLPVPGSSEVVGGLVVFDIYANSSRRVLNASVSTQPGSGFSFQVNGTDVNPGAPIAVGADGIALTPDGLFLFWTALTSRDLWRIPTCVLRDATLSDEAVNASVVHVLLKPGASDGMAFADTMGAPASVSRPSPNNTCTAADLVGAGSYQLLATDIEHATLWSFTGDLTRASVGGSITITPVSLVSDPATMLWPDSIGFSNDGALLFTSNHLNAFNTGSLDYSRVNFRVLLAQPDSPSAPLYSYISLAPDSDTFFFFTGAGAGDAPCIGNPFGIHTVSSSAPDQCLYTPNDRNSFKMQCSFNSSSGGNATAHFAAYPGPSCEGAPSLGSGSILADGRSCTSLGGSYSAYASCHQERTRAAPAPANGLDTFVWAGYTTNCSLRESVAVHYTQSGVCLLTANDGFSLISTCDDQTGASSVQLFGSPDCAAATQFAQGAGPGDGVTCLELNSLGANPQRIGSYTTACHMRDRLSAAIRISGIGGLSWIALVAAPLAALMLGARS